MKAGDRVGRYTLVSRHATGGMAEVWLAQVSGAHLFKKTVVLKVLFPHLAEDPECVRMFIAEALLGSILEHPNVVHIFDHGEADETSFIAMEYVAGRTLRAMERDLRAAGKLLPPWLVLRSAISVCDALEHAYLLRDDEGNPLHIVHRDVTPENIMISALGVTKVLDFGIAKVSTSVVKTQKGVLKGKLCYLAPEQLTGASGEGDPRGDLFALGVVLSEMLAGQRPFGGENELILLKEIVEKEPPPPSQLSSDLSPQVDAVVLKAIEKAPERRYQSAGEMRGAIDSLLRSMGPYPTERDVADYLSATFGDAPPGGKVPGTPTPSKQGFGSLGTPSASQKLGSELAAKAPPETEPDRSAETRIESRGTSRPGKVRPLVRVPPGATDKATVIVQQEDVSHEPGGESYEEFAARLHELHGPEAAPETAPKPPLASAPPSPEERPVAAAVESPSRLTPSAGIRTSPKAASVWDSLTQRAQERKEQESSTDAPKEPEAPAARPKDSREGIATGSHVWDAVVQKQAPSAPKPPATPRGSAAGRPELQALARFDEGLEHMRNRNLDAALEAWEEALALAPDNRLIQSNLRKLRKLMEERR